MITAQTKHSLKLWLGVGSAIAAVILGIIFLVNKSKSSDTVVGTPAPVSSSDWIKGNAYAKVLITEYADFQCPACEQYYWMLKKLEENPEIKIGVVFRHFPLSQIHDNAFLAAQAAEAAGRQGKFWGMYDLLFLHQRDWSEDKNAKNIFTDYARQLQLNEEQFLQDIEAPEIQEKISNSYKEGVSVGINGTPAFFINGKKIDPPQSYEDFENVITQEMSL